MASLETELQDLFNGGDAADGDEAGTNLAAAIEAAEMAHQLPLGISGSASRLHMGAGVPAAGLGANGDFYFRTDGSGGSAIYFKAGGSWGALA